MLCGRWMNTFCTLCLLVFVVVEIITVYPSTMGCFLVVIGYVAATPNHVYLMCVSGVFDIMTIGGCISAFCIKSAFKPHFPYCDIHRMLWHHVGGHNIGFRVGFTNH